MRSATESAEWEDGLTHQWGPVLTRQALLLLDPAFIPEDVNERGMCVLRDPDRAPGVTLIPTGSKVHRAREVAAVLVDENGTVRVGPRPSMERFEAQPETDRHEAPPPDGPPVVAKAGTTRGLLVGGGGTVLGVDRFGFLGPGEEVYGELGFLVDRVVKTVHDVLEGASRAAAPPS